MIEMLIAIAILGALTKGFMTLTQNANKQEMRMVDTISVRTGLETIRSTLGNPKSCEKLFLDKRYSRFNDYEDKKSVEITEILDVDGELIFKKGDKIDHITINKILIKPTESYSKLFHEEEVIGKLDIHVEFKTRLRLIEKTITMRVYASWVNEELKWVVQRCKSVESELLSAAKIASCQSQKITLSSGETLVGGWDDKIETCIIQPEIESILIPKNATINNAENGELACSKLGQRCESVKSGAKQYSCNDYLLGDPAGTATCAAKLFDVVKDESGTSICISADMSCRFTWNKQKGPVACSELLIEETSPGAVLCY